MRKLFAIVLACGACVLDPATAAETRGIVYPEDFGGAPGDDLDDRPAIQAAVDLACLHGADVDLGPGIWDVTRSPAGTYNRFSGIALHCSRVAIYGAGMYETTIRMRGDVGGSTANVISLDPGASEIALSEFSIDTSGTWHQDEQSTAIEIGSGVCNSATCSAKVQHVLVERVAINHPPTTDGTRKGDCLRVFGNYEATAAVDVRLIGMAYISCARSGIAMQRNADGVTIVANYFDGDAIGDTPIDGEATGGGWQHGLVISANQIRQTVAGKNNYAIAMTSQEGFSVTGNVIVGRGINLYRGSGGVIADNSIDATDMLTDVAVIEIGNAVERVSISSNALRRRGQRGALVRVRPTPGVSGPNVAAGLAINDNVGRSDTDGAGIQVDSGSAISISGNALIGSGAPASTGIYVQAGSKSTQGIVANGNALDGFAYAGLRFDPGPHPISAAVLGNTTTRGGPGLRCDDVATWLPGSLSAYGNTWSTPAVCGVP